jgi:hypothetical protein
MQLSLVGDGDLEALYHPKLYFHQNYIFSSSSFPYFLVMELLSISIINQKKKKWGIKLLLEEDI